MSPRLSIQKQERIIRNMFQNALYPCVDLKEKNRKLMYDQIKKIQRSEQRSEKKNKIILSFK